MNVEEKQEMEAGSVGYSDAFEALRSGEVRPLTELYNIEATLAMIKKINDQVDYYKELKKRRTASIDDEIKKLNDRVEFLKNVVTETLKSNKEKKVKFPGIGSVSRRVKKGNWVVKNEESLLEILRERNEYDNVVTETPKIVKKDLNKLLDVWESAEELPDSVEKEDDSESLTIRFEQEVNLDDTPDLDEIDVPEKNQNKQDDVNFGDLDFS